MAFSLGSFGRSTADATVVLRAETGQFNREVDEAERNWTTATKSMSREAIRLDLAQERLQRSLQRYGQGSAQAKRAILQLKDAEEAATRQTNQLVAALGRLRASGSGLGTRGSALMGTVGIGVGVGVAAAAGIELRRAVNAASDLNEQISKAGQVFGESARDVLSWSTTTADGIGIARDKALEAAGTFGNLLVATGQSEAQAASMSRTLVQLGADLASFNNTSPEEALDAIRSGLVGEVEPLRRYGVLLSEARVQQEAMRRTGKDNAKQLTESEKATARYNLILQQTKPAQGDFARTAGSAANQTRRLRANVRDLEADLGSTFIPVVADATGHLAALAHAMRTTQITAQQLANDPALRDRIAEVFGKDALFDLLNATPSAGLTAAGLVEEIRTRIQEGQTDPKTGKKKPLTRSQKLDLRELEATLTATLDDDLAAAKARVAWARDLASNSKLEGDALYEARRRLLEAQQRVQSIEDQIISDREAAAEKRNRRVRESTEAAARKERAERARQAAIVARTLTPSPYANTSSGFNKAGIDPGLARRIKTSTTGASDPKADFARMTRDFLEQFNQMRDLGPNIQMGGIHVHTTANNVDPSDLQRGARWASFHFREALTG